MKHFGNTTLDIVSLSLSLFLLMDGIGNVPLYIIYLKNIPPQKQLYVILRELLIALFVIILFSYVGEFVLNILNISQPSLLISGGMILFIIALRMIFPPVDREVGIKMREPFIVPLAIPFVAGPSVLAAVMIYSKHAQNHWILLSSILIAWFFTMLVLLSSSILKKWLGDKGLAALECLMGLILTLISVQMFLEGISLFMNIHS